MRTPEQSLALIRARQDLTPTHPLPRRKAKDAAEGGCGVIGMAASVPIPGRVMLTALRQMRNRGNGKSGGIAVAGLSPAFFGVAPQVMANDTLLAIAHLEPDSRAEVEGRAIAPFYEVNHVFEVPHLEDYRALDLETRPPEAGLYFVRSQPGAPPHFAEEKGLTRLPADAVADEFVYQTRTPTGSTAVPMPPPARSGPSSFPPAKTRWSSRWWITATMWCPATGWRA